MDPLAIGLNTKIKSGSPTSFACLSELGREIFFPAGILTQSAEAKENAHRFNATIGIATEKNQPMYLAATKKFFNHLAVRDIYAYAPPGGRPKLRQLWQQKLVKSNPSLAGKKISLPMVTQALTHGLSIAADLFVQKDDVVIIPDKFWGVYRLNFQTRKGARIVTYPLFNNKGFNVEGFEKTLEAEALRQNKLIVVLNFPNNPTGYTPLLSEAEAIYDVVRKIADRGNSIVVLLDDAYFGLFYEDSIQESMFSGFCDLHEHVLAVKLDGVTKESYAWGFRTGFITFGTKAIDPEALYPALEMKTQGIIRGTVSSCNHASQSIIEEALEDPDYWDNLAEKNSIMEKRAVRLKQVLKDEKFQKVWDTYPFNSGYFMCLKLHTVEAEKLRQHLLSGYGIGTIASGRHDLRIAFSCIEEGDLAELFDLIYQAVLELEA